MKHGDKNKNKLDKNKNKVQFLRKSMEIRKIYIGR